MSDDLALVPPSSGTGPEADPPSGEAAPTPSGPAETPGRRLPSWLRRLLADSFSRNAYALIANTALTGVLGVFFWIVAARLYSPVDVGHGSALISAATLIASIIGMNLTGTLNRFLPRAGSGTRRLVAGTYLVSVAAILVLTVTFLFTVALWSGSYSQLRSPWIAVLWGLTVLASGIFTVQDGIFVGLRQAVWVPLENGAFGLGKLVMLPLLAASVPLYGVWAAWMIPLAATLVPVNLLIFGRLIPRHVRRTIPVEAATSPRDIRRFVAGDYLGALLGFGALYFVPVIVAGTLPAQTFAYFYIAWMAVAILNLIAVNLGHSMTVEGVHTPERLRSYFGLAIARSMALLVLAAIVIAAAGRWVLGFLGEGYVHASTLLLLLALAAVPRALVELWLGVLRAQGRSRAIAIVQVASGTLTVGGTVLALALGQAQPGHPDGTLTRIGVVFAISQAVIAIAVLPSLIGFLRHPTVPASSGVEPTRPSTPSLAARSVPTPPPAVAISAGPARGAVPRSPEAEATSLVTLTARMVTVPLREAPSLVTLQVVARPPSAPSTTPAEDTSLGETPSSSLEKTSEAPPDERPEGAVEETTSEPAPPGPPPPRWGAPENRGALLVASVGIAGLIAFLLPLRGVDLEALDGYGLVSVLPVASLVGIAVLAVAFVAALGLATARPWLLGALLVVITVCLHGVTLVLEPLPRFPQTWTHLGFVEFISRTGAVATDLDARFSWPGFFALGSFLSSGADPRALAAVVALVPVVSNLFYLAALALLLRSIRAAWQAKWFALFLFSVLDWVGQDYFSPQGYTYLLSLIFFAVLLLWFRKESSAAHALATPTVPRTRPGRWVAAARTTVLDSPPVRVPRRAVGAGSRAAVRGVARGLRTVLAVPVPDESGELPPAPASLPARTALYLLLIGLFLVTVASHQLTPFVMVGSVACLVLARRLVTTRLPVLMAAILLGWVSFLTAGFWSGHLGELLHGLGAVTSNIASSVGARAGAGGRQHGFVVDLRLAISAVTILLAVVGAWRRRRRGLSDRVLWILGLVPFGTIALQSYGGEIALRVYLFALPAVAILGACALFPEPRPARVRPVRLVAAGFTAVVLVLGFLVAAYGNESYEYNRPGDLAAAQAIYAQPGEQVRVFYPAESYDPGATLSGPFGYTQDERVQARGLYAPRDPAAVDAVVSALRDNGADTYLLLDRSQLNYLQISAGYGEGWGDRYRAALIANPAMRVVFADPDAAVLAVRGSETEAPNAYAPLVLGTRVLPTPWTTPGVIVLGLLLVLLVVQELLRLRYRRASRHFLRPLTWVWVVLGLGVVAVVAERFVALT